jgi:hypothetical protein
VEAAEMNGIEKKIKTIKKQIQTVFHLNILANTAPLPTFSPEIPKNRHSLSPLRIAPHRS